MTVRHWFSLCRLFTRQDLSTRFQGNVGGLAWAFAAPVLQLGIFYFVFTQIFKARVPGLEGVGYLAFLALGFWPWFAFSEAVGGGTPTSPEKGGMV
jgi:lipopolysaccharide transport system permease protein